LKKILGKNENQISHSNSMTPYNKSSNKKI